MAYRMLGAQVRYAFENTIDVKKLFVELKDATLVDSSYLGIPAAAFGELRYSSIEEVVGDLMKLTGESDLTKLVPELAEFQSETIQASSHAPVPFTSRMRSIIDSREIADLAEVDQLGLVKLIYPVASHSRMEHALGTTALAVKYARALVADTINPIFKQLMSKEHLESLILAALTHDIGHYPLAHDLEEVEPKVFHHELRTAHLLSRPDSEVRRMIETDSWSASVEDILAIHRKPRDDGENDNSPLRTQVLRSIIDGPIDADKVDYLTRDSQNLRLPYGIGIDVDKLISTLTVVVSSDTQGLEARLGIHEKGRIPAESVAFARYALFGSAYWHKTHRVLKAMLSRIAMEALWKLKQAYRDSYQETARRELYQLLGESDDQLLDLGTGMSEERVQGSRLDSMSQLVVLWLAKQASIGETVPFGEDGEFRRLAVDLLQRKHFKRVLVISRVRAENQNRPWQKIDRLFGQTTDTWENRRLASIGLQNRVSALAAVWLDRPRAPESKEVALLCAEFVRRTAAGAPLIILDSPPAGKVGSSRPLEILHEPYWVADARAELSVSEIEDSSVWSALAGSYPQSLGKIRVFCNPDFVPLVGLLAKRQELEQLVWDAVAKDSKI